MFRIALWASLCAALWSFSFIACSGGGSTGDNSCQADRNCLSNEKCYQGKCVLASEVPNNNNSTGNSNTPVNNNNGTANTNNQGNTNNVENNNNGTANTNNQTNANNNNATPIDYPEGPYGADVGDVAIPLTFDNCDGSKKKSFKDWFQDKSVKVILVTVHTGW